ncbi:MAG: tRNA dihydrouridine(20/20a) synthase DusA, partial [Gallionellaceae bacterium]|nr:tRNA dihydrouridine(20/20a) synthase DusA [Gallionellaceae bacterium]
MTGNAEITEKTACFRVSVAPMMDWTDRHCRFFLRQFSPRVLLYTEMITAQAILRGRREALLQFSPEEQPLAVQLGGSDPAQLAAAAQAAEQAGYIEVNLNCGCPSDRVSAGAFGACLMLDAPRVAQCVAAMRAVVRVPVTVKLRIGVVDRSRPRDVSATAAMQRFDEADFDALAQFCTQVVAAGAQRLVVHARKAVLGGLSPHENRTVPPLRYDVVSKLRALFPSTPVVVNGGFRTTDAVLTALHDSDGVMIGREAYHQPRLLAQLQQALYPHDAWTPPEDEAVLDAMCRYAVRECAAGTPLAAITRHMLGLLAGRPGARA